MKLLSIDSSGRSISAAILEFDDTQRTLLGSFNIDRAHNHSLTLLPMMNALLEGCGLSLDQMDAFAVTAGPGSFTGLRIGMATIQGWCMALDKPAILVPSTAATAHAAANGGLICPIFDARRNEVYTALFCGSERIWEDKAISPQELAQALSALDKPVTLVGDATRSWGEFICSAVGANCRIAQPERLFMAASAAVLAADKFLQKDFTPTAQLLPFYLRRSEAEEKLLGCAISASSANSANLAASAAEVK